MSEVNTSPRSGLGPHPDRVAGGESRLILLVALRQ
jgi:hypothetical protein